MTSASSQDERTPPVLGRGLRPEHADGGVPSGAAARTEPGGHLAPPARLPSLSPAESSVLNALSEARHLSFGVLRSRTGTSVEELRETLSRLRAMGLVTQLNTVVESYSSRFPGLRVDD